MQENCIYFNSQTELWLMLLIILLVEYEKWSIIKPGQEKFHRRYSDLNLQTLNISLRRKHESITSKTNIVDCGKLFKISIVNMAGTKWALSLQTFFFIFDTVGIHSMASQSTIKGHIHVSKFQKHFVKFYILNHSLNFVFWICSIFHVHI